MTWTYCLIWHTTWRLKTDSSLNTPQRWVSKKFPHRSTRWFTALMKPSRKRLMSSQATGTKFHGQPRLMKLDASVRIELLTKLLPRASQRKIQRSTVRKSSRRTFPSHREAPCEVETSKAQWAPRMAISTGKRTTLSRKVLSTLTDLTFKLSQRWIKETIEVHRSSTQLKHPCPSHKIKPLSLVDRKYLMNSHCSLVSLMQVRWSQLSSPGCPPTQKVPVLVRVALVKRRRLHALRAPLVTFKELAAHSSRVWWLLRHVQV